MMKITAYATNKGTFFKLDTTPNNSIKINGIPSTELVFRTVRSASWLRVDGDIESVTMTKPETSKLVGWNINNPAISCEVLPVSLPADAIVVDSDTYRFSGTHAEYAQLYSPVYETTPEREIDVEFEVRIADKLVIEDASEPEKMTISTYDGGSFRNDTRHSVDLSSIVSFNEIDEILTPEFALHHRPCSLTSEQMYKIVRRHVRENINPKVARITSDYDFCFTVKKVINDKPSPSKSKKKVEELIEVFEMTYFGYGGKKNGYDGYTPIPAFSASSLKKLHENLKKYLDDLMDTINTPVHKCEHCDGVGFITARANHPST